MASLFFSYSHKDETLRNELEIHLAMLKREGTIEAWHDRKIMAGDDFGMKASVPRWRRQMSFCFWSAPIS